MAVEVPQIPKLLQAHQKAAAELEALQALVLLVTILKVRYLVVVAEVVRFNHLLEQMVA